MSNTAGRTFEGSAKTKNSIMRVAFCLISILLEVGLILLIVTKLNAAAPWLEVGARVIAVLLVLYIYSRDMTSSYKMPWIMLILSLPVLGLVLYILVGQNHGTKRMRERYRKIDEALLVPFDDLEGLIPEVSAACSRAGSIAGYIRRESHYPI